MRITREKKSFNTVTRDRELRCKRGLDPLIRNIDPLIGIHWVDLGIEDILQQKNKKELVTGGKPPATGSEILICKNFRERSEEKENRAEWNIICFFLMKFQIYQTIKRMLYTNQILLRAEKLFYRYKSCSQVVTSNHLLNSSSSLWFGLYRSELIMFFIALFISPRMLFVEVLDFLFLFCWFELITNNIFVREHKIIK